MRISIFGLGYVGAVSAGCLARDGHEVVGCDIDDAKLELFRNGRTPIIEEGMEALISDAVGSGRLTVTDNTDEALHSTELSFVCVGTPSTPNGGQDLGAVERICEQLGSALRSRTEYHVVVMRSTVLPGTMEEIVRPLLEQHSGKRVGVEFGLCFQPEFLREGSSIKDYDDPPYTVVGSEDDRAVEILRRVFSHLPCEFLHTSTGSAELLKYCCNSFHALKITFANEIGCIAQSQGVDPHAVMELVCKDRHLNISPAYLKPGFAFGGSCLPKDLRALMYCAKRTDVETPMLAGILPSNRTHIEHAIDIVLRSNVKSVGMIGLSFKTGTDDLRESPLVALAERFIGKGLKLSIHDPAVSLARLLGANRRFIEESIPHISSLLTDSCEELISTSQIVIVGIDSPESVDRLYQLGRDDQIVLDLGNFVQRERISGRYYGVCW